MPLNATTRHAGALFGVLVILAPLCQADEDIRELRAAKALPGTAPWGLIGAGVLVLALMGWLFWQWRRRRLRAPRLSAAEAALARLEASRPLLVSTQAREFCDAASDVVRAYIESQFNLLAPQRTTEEFLKELSQMPATPLASHQDTLAEFMRRCDFVRFSGATTSNDSLESLFQTARRFILDTDQASRDPLPAA